ncbi:hypothetical protein OS493_017699 [Desmophyllum pertusum]|uniref:Uncharacterized protein n=1 Tax=Desmophyllum pertusum TaxID=174260 RepID=A0A9X0CXI5_9CNID|nr:hypothetical protein OS493_017699 [Desmophyllum pertusum]
MTITSTWKQSQKQKGGPPHSKNTNQYSRGKVSKLNNANVEQHQAQIDPPEAERSIQVLGELHNKNKGPKPFSQGHQSGEGSNGGQQGADIPKSRTSRPPSFSDSPQEDDKENEKEKRDGFSKEDSGTESDTEDTTEESSEEDSEEEERPKPSVNSVPPRAKLTLNSLPSKPAVNSVRKPVDESDSEEETGSETEESSERGGRGTGQTCFANKYNQFYGKDARGVASSERASKRAKTWGGRHVEAS